MTQELPEGTVTILFTDVVGSTELTNRLGDEAAREVLGGSDELVREQIGRHRGQEVKGTGDGLMVAFTSARRAIACAIDIQRAVAARNGREPERAVGVRVGLNTGEVIREEADLFGATVNAAERIAGHASPGEILVSDGVKYLLGAATTVELEERGEVQLRGFPEAWRLYAVRWEEEPAGLALAERTPFVGREEERLQLRQLLEHATRGEGTLVMIGGESGVGKTRLSQELAQEARERGVLTLTGHCYEMEGAPPHIPFIEILEAAGRVVPPEAFREALGDAAPEVAKLMPELRRMFPDIPPATELPAEQERRYLFNSILEFVERASRAQPLLLVLEDLHWGDDSSLLLLQHIAQQLGEMPVLVVGTYRDVELDVARPLAKALEDILRQRLAHDVTLRRLPESDVEAMLRARSGQEPPARLVEVIYRETEGNPFFVEEVFKHLAEAGRLFDDKGRWRSDLEIGEQEVPRGVRLVIGRRLERVSEECRRVLTAAAIVGRAFSYELLQRLVDVDEDALLDAVDEAERAQLVSSAAVGGEARFTFSHEQIRQTLLAVLSLPRRQRLHLRAAEALEQTHAHALEEHTADLAYHLYQAGTGADPQKTVHYLSRAGKRALAATAYEEGTRLYQTALEALDRQETPDEPQRCDLLLALGEARWKVGETPGATESFLQAAAVARKLGLPELLARAALGLAGPAVPSGSVDKLVVNRLERALEALSKEDSALRARVLASLAVQLLYADAHERRAAVSQEAVAIARRVGDTGVLADALSARHVAIWGPENVDERLTVATEIVQLAEEAGNQWQALQGHLLRLIDLLELGDIPAVDVEIEAHAQLAEELRQPFHLWRTVLVRVMRALLAGRFEESERLIQQGVLVGQRAGQADVLQFLGVQMFALRREQGRLEELETPVQNLIQQYPAVPAWRAALGYLYSELGREADARSALESLAGSELASLPRDINWLIAVTLLSETCAFLGDPRQAARLYDILLPYAGRNVIVGNAAACNGPASRHLALLAATMGRWDEAERHFEEALEMNVRMGARPGFAHTQYGYARMLLDRDGSGDRDKAFRLVTEALAIYREIGMPKHTEMAEALLGQV